MDERVKRQDLLTAANIAKPEGYIGHQVAPALIQYQKTGVIYYVTAGSNANVVNGRTPGATVTPTSNTGTPLSFSCAERSDRQLVDDSEINQYGGWDKYQLNLAATAYVNVADLVEAAIASALFAEAAAELTETGTLLKILEAVDALKGKRGKLALVGSQSALRALRVDSTITDALKNTGMVPGDVDPRFVSNAVLAAACNVSVVLEGLDVLWPADGLAAIVLADPAFEPKQLKQSFRTVRYQPDQGPDAGLYLCYEGYDPSRKGKFVDVEAFATPYVLNSDLIKIIAGSTASSGSSSSSGA